MDRSMDNWTRGQRFGGYGHAEVNSGLANCTAALPSSAPIHGKCPDRQLKGTDEENIKSNGSTSVLMRSLGCSNVYNENTEFTKSCDIETICKKSRILPNDKQEPENRILRDTSQHARKEGKYRSIRGFWDNQGVVLQQQIRGLPKSAPLRGLIANDMNKPSVRTSRSLGAWKTSTRSARSVEPFKHLRPQPKAQTTDPSSYFDIESHTDTSDLLEESPIPYDDIEATITSPHNPPYESTNENQPQKTMKQSIIDSHNNAIFPMADYFQDYMEERMVRWRPSDSQFNIDDTMNGTHPYQQELQCKRKNDKLSNNFLISLKNWFTAEKAAKSDIENQLQITEETNNTNIIIAPKSSRNLSQANPGNTPDFVQCMKAIQFRANSSTSIIASPSRAMFSQSQNATLLLQSNLVINHEPSPVEILNTPKALPFNGFELNFEKREDGSNTRVDRDSDEIINTMDEDVRDLLNGFDNFLSECFSSIWGVFVSVGRNCTSEA